MLNKEKFKEMELYLKEEDSMRENIIAQSRVVLKHSKSAIYSIHRKDLSAAKVALDEAKAITATVETLMKKHPHLQHSFNNALEEFVEAECFYHFVSDKHIPSHSDLGVDPFTYLAGLSDLTGELARKSVLEAIAKNKSEVQSIRELVDEIYGAMIRFDFRNGELRKKADAIKWNLSKVEELLHDLAKKE